MREWKEIAKNTKAMVVPGGMLVRYKFGGEAYADTGGVAMVFVPSKREITEETMDAWIKESSMT